MLAVIHAELRLGAQLKVSAVSHAKKKSAYTMLDGPLVQSRQLCLYQHLDVKVILETACMSANCMQAHS
jgi:hypothetical protein